MSLNKCRSESLNQKSLISGSCLGVMYGSLVLKQNAFPLEVVLTFVTLQHGSRICTF